MPHLDDPAVAAVHDTALERLAAIDRDLEHWLPGGVRTVELGRSLPTYAR